MFRRVLKYARPSNLRLATDVLTSAYLRDVVANARGTRGVQCNICGFTGRFAAFGHPPRYDAVCPSCKSLERHRLVHLWMTENPDATTGRVLHFAPEPVLEAFLRSRASHYVSADLTAKADRVINAEAMDLPDAGFDLILLSHVLEHVDDRKTLAELYRVVARGGFVLILVPVIEGWPTTYENPAVVSPQDRTIHFGQYDHARYYGRDIRNRITGAGFLLDEFRASPAIGAAHGLMRGETVFVARR